MEAAAGERAMSAQSSRCRQLTGALIRVLVVLALAAPALADTCTEVQGHVEFRGLQVVPAAPGVGDEVELNFDVGFAVYSVTAVRLQGASPLLDGTTVLYGTRDTAFRLTAVQSGSTMLQLLVTYGTEEQCEGPYGRYFRLGPDRTVMSPLYVVDIAEAPPSCAGDCNGNGQVDVTELVQCVFIALGYGSPQSCGVDRDQDGGVSVSELVAAVDAALTDCPPPTPTNPPGRCCECPASTFVECQRQAQGGSCRGWGDPCPTPTP